MPAPVLSGDRVVLRPLEERDVEVRRSYGWHREIERGYGHVRATGPMTEAEAQQWYADLLPLRDEPSWIIEVDGRAAGGIFLHSHVVEDRRARLAIGLFAPELQGHGYGTEAVLLVLAHAFGAMGLHRVDLRVLDVNAGAIACYRRCGFVEEGRERESCQVDGVWRDDIVMGILDREFRALAALPRSAVSGSPTVDPTGAARP